MASVELERVTKVYSRGVIAVQELDLDVQDGELLVLLGPSGSGKTTCLRLIAGLERPSGGRIRMGGREMTRVAPRERNVSLIFQQGALFPHWNVRRNMACGLEFRCGGWVSRVWQRCLSRAKAAAAADSRRICQKVNETAELLGIGHLLDRMPRQLSGGERQRVALGRALVRQPAVFLWDEPLSSLDEGLRFELRREVRRLQRGLRATMVLVTHDQEEAMALADRIAVLDRGRVQQVDRPGAIYDRPCNRFVAGFVGCPAMNFFRGVFSDESGRLWFCGGGLRVELPRGWSGRCVAGGHVELGVRPEHVRLVTGPVGLDRPSVAVAGEGWVSDVELLGDRQLVYVELNKRAEGERPTEFLCKVTDRASFVPGQHVRLVLDRNWLYGFDSVTGESFGRLGDVLPEAWFAESKRGVW